MYRVTTLTSRNLQGLTFQDELHPITLYVGDNARGKTTRINALHLALAGYVPGVSKKGCDIFAAFASGNPLFVFAHISDGSVIVSKVSRTWEERKGSVKTDELWIGPKVEIPPVAIDADMYFGLSGPAQTRFLFSCAKLPPELTIPNLCNAITANIKNIKVEENTEGTERAIKELVEFISRRDNYDGGARPQDWVCVLAEDFKNRLKESNQNAQRMEKTVQGITQIREQSEPVSQDAEALLQAAVKETDVAKALVDTLRERGKLKGAILHALKIEAAGAVDETVARKRLEELACEIERLGTIQDRGHTLVSEQQIRELKSAQNAATSAMMEVSSVSTQLSQLKSDLAHAQEEKNCPTCGQSTTHIKKALADSLRSKIQVKESEKRLADKALSGAQQTAQALLARSDKIAQELKDYQATCDAFHKSKHEHGGINEKLGRNAKANEASLKIPQLEKELAELRTEFIAAEQDRDKKVKIEHEADVQYRRLLKERGEAASRAQAITDAQKARVEASVLKQAVDLVLSLQAELVQKTVGPIIESCNRLCAGILEHPLAYKDGEIGMAKPNGFITKTLSGTERALTRCAVSMALAAESPLKLVVLDEMGRLSARNKMNVVMNIVKLLADETISQAILVDTDADDYKLTMFPTSTFGIIKV
jgi:hypothetical protein